MRFFFTAFLFGLIHFSLSAQSVNIPAKAGDLAGAISIKANQTLFFNQSPQGFGQVQEFKPNPYRPSFVFKEERNTVWLLIPIPASGSFCFELSPKSTKDDYDWMLYKYHSKLLGAIAKDVARPLRTNVSRNDGTMSGKTGMKEGFSNPYTSPGPGPIFSKPLEVKKGDTLALVIDNIYPNGGGFVLSSSIKTNIILDGIIKGRVIAATDKRSLPATVICEDDSTGQQLSSAKANSRGEYTLKVPLRRSVNVVASMRGYIFKTEDTDTDVPVKVLNFSLDSVITGNKVILFNIHFAPNKDLILPNALPDITRLVKFLKEYPDLNIRIVGHANNNPFEDAGYLQRLSFMRAFAVKKKLIAAGILEDRLACMGVGGKQPLTTSRVTSEAMKNLRVEIELRGMGERE